MAKNKSYIGIKNEVATGTLELYFLDYIYDGWDWNTYEEIKMVKDTIDKIKAANPTKIIAYVNSLGGDVQIGLAIYNYLTMCGIPVETRNIGFAGSIASIMMCAGKPVKVARNSFTIIHPAWAFAAGNATDLRKQADDLDKVTDQLAEIYATKSGKHDAAFFKNLWKDGDYWMTGEEAVEFGLADEVIDAVEVNASMDVTAYNFRNVPSAILNAVKPGENPSDQETFFTKLNNSFMKLVDTLKAALTGAKADPEINNVPGSDRMIAAFEKHFMPFAEAVDAASEEKPEEVKPEVKEETPAEVKPTEVKPTEKEEVKEENADLKAANERILKMEQEMKEMKASLARNSTKPDALPDASQNAKASKAKIEYA